MSRLTDDKREGVYEAAAGVLHSVVKGCTDRDGSWVAIKQSAIDLLRAAVEAADALPSHERTPTPDWLFALEKLEMRATPGPWQAWRSGNCKIADGTGVGQSELRPVPRPYDARWIGYEDAETALARHHTTILRDEDADFVAALRNAWPKIKALADRSSTRTLPKDVALCRRGPVGERGIHWRPIPAEEQAALLADRSATREPTRDDVLHEVEGEVRKFRSELEIAGHPIKAETAWAIEQFVRDMRGSSRADGGKAS